jgi:hypothetical protein
MFIHSPSSARSNIWYSALTLKWSPPKHFALSSMPIDRLLIVSSIIFKNYVQQQVEQAVAKLH